ncbi:MAG: hypothetical protein Q8P20_08185 [bacterium]|nr:hypothetical protein [bacterium]
MNEQTVEKNLREYLRKEGWSLTNLPRTVGQHGCDITAWHKKYRKVLLIEAKGDGNTKNKHQTIHNSFYTLLGQILSRMDKEGNNPKKARIYAIAIPAHWAQAYKKKIKQMPYGWKLLKLRVFLVSEDKVENKNYRYFL